MEEKSDTIHATGEEISPLERLYKITLLSLMIEFNSTTVQLSTEKDNTTLYPTKKILNCGLRSRKEFKWIEIF